MRVGTPACVDGRASSLSFNRSGVSRLLIRTSHVMSKSLTYVGGSPGRIRTCGTRFRKPLVSVAWQGNWAVNATYQRFLMVPGVDGPIPLPCNEIGRAHV